MKIPQIKLPFNLSITRTQDFEAMSRIVRIGELNANSESNRIVSSDWKAFSDKERDYTFDLPKRTLYDLWRASSVLLTIQIAIKFAVFRNGGHWVEEFISKCNDCGRKYQYKKSVCLCGGKTRGPDYKQLQFAGEWFDGGWVNANKKTLMDVLEMIDPDYQVVDDAYLQIRKEYEFDQQGFIVAGHVTEILPADTLKIEFVQDGSFRFGFDKSGKPRNVCPKHRESAGDFDRCPQCGLAAYPAHFVARTVDKGKEKEQYFLEDEILHESKYGRTMGHGQPPAYACFNLVNAFISMDKYIDATYSGERYPRSLLFLKTNMDKQSLQNMWTEYLQKLSANPRHFSPIPITGTGDSGPITEFVKLFDTLVEMQFIETRQAGRSEIGAIFGVQPIFMGDNSSSGGLNNEGLQITVTNRGTEMGQAPHNRMLKRLCLMFGITDFAYRLMPNEEADEAADEDLENKRLTNARLAAELGLSVERGEDGKFNFSGKVDSQRIGQSAVPGNGQQPSPSPQMAGGIIGASQSVPPAGTPETSSITKESRKPKRLNGDELDDVLASIADDIKYKRKVPESVMTKRVEALAKKMGSRLEQKTKEEILSIYSKEAARVAMDAGGIAYSFSAPDNNAIEAITSQPVFTKAFSGMTSKMQEKLQRIISDSYSKEKFSFDDMVSEMAEEVNAQKSDLERIARTEGQNISNIARTNAYQKVLPPETKYEWSIQSDHRTTEYCRKIHEEAKKGVSMDELRRIVKENSDRNTYDPSRPWTPHLNCRSILIRKV